MCEYTVQKTGCRLYPEYLDEYQRQLNDISTRLVVLNHTLSDLEAISNFPFNRIRLLEGNTFWNVVWWNFRYISINYLYTLMLDTNSLTIEKLQKRLSEEWILEKDRAEFYNSLKEIKHEYPKKSREELEKKLRCFRHQFVAHRLLDNGELPEIDQQPSVSFADLRELYHIAERMFIPCCLGSHHLMSFGGTDPNGSLNEVLNLVARHSPFVNEPERLGSSWPTARAHKSPEELASLNEWRRKLGMSEV